MSDRPFRLGLAALLAVVGLTCGCATHGARAVSKAAAARPIERTLLAHYDLPQLPGWELRLYLIVYAPGVVAPRHYHPVPGLGYVVRGSFESAFEGEAQVLVRAGQSFKDLAAIPHVTFRNADSSKPLEFVIAYVVPRGAPVVRVP